MKKYYKGKEEFTMQDFKMYPLGDIQEQEAMLKKLGSLI